VEQAWKLVPAEPTREMWQAVNKLDDEMAAGSYDGKGCTIEQAWDCMLAAAPLPPNETMTLEEARSGQHWRGMDGACAWHLIFRHADGWGETATMMQAWLDANREMPNVI